MTYKLVYSPESLDDLDRIWAEVWAASEDFETADRYPDDLRIAIRAKKKYPKTGTPLTYMGEFSGIYMVSFKAYIAFYRIRGDRIEVGRVLFAGSDYMKTLFGISEFVPEDAEN